VVNKDVQRPQVCCPSCHLSQDCLHGKALLQAQLRLKPGQFGGVVLCRAELRGQILILQAQTVVFRIDATRIHKGLAVGADTFDCRCQGAADTAHGCLHAAQDKAPQFHAIGREAYHGRQHEEQRNKQQACRPPGDFACRASHSLYQDLVQNVVVLEDLSCPLGNALQRVFSDIHQDSGAR